MKKIYFYVLLVFSSLNFVSGQEYFFENFAGGQIPNNWEITQTNSEETWEISLEQPNGGYMAVITGSPNGGQENEWLITPSIDLSEATNPAFYFTSNYSSYSLIDMNYADYLVYASKDGGNTWEQIWLDSDGYLFIDYELQLAVHNLNVSTYAGESDVKFAFRLYTENNFHEFTGTIWIDEIRVEENQQSPVESITVTTQGGVEPEVIIGNNLQLEATVLPSNSNPNVIWSVSNGFDVVSVSDYGYVTSLSVGTATVRATSAESADIYGEIEITVIEDPFNDGCNQRFYGGGTEFFSIRADLDRIGASDFIVAANSNFTLNTLSPTLLPGTFTNANPSEFNTFDITIRQDDSGAPGEIIESFDGVPYTYYEGQMVYKVHIDLPESYVLEGGENGTKYWVTISAISTTGVNIAWHGTPIEENAQTTYSYRSEDGGATWNPLNWNGGEELYELSLDIAGSCEELNVSDLDSFDFSYYPNPVNDVLYLKSKKNIEEISIFNLAGQKIINKIQFSNGQINVNNLTAGVYIFRVQLEKGQIETFKVIKK